MPDMEQFTYNSLVEITMNFYNSADVLTDPTTLTLKVYKPRAVEPVDPDPTPTSHPSTGVYTLQVRGDEVGIWWVRAIPTGAVDAPLEVRFRILPSKFD